MFVIPLINELNKLKIKNYLDEWDWECEELAKPAVLTLVEAIVIADIYEGSETNNPLLSDMLDYRQSIRLSLDS